MQIKISLPPTIPLGNEEIKRYHTKVIGRLRCHYGDSNENVKKAIGLDYQNNNSARAPSFFVHFFAVRARLWRELPNSRFIDNANIRRQISLSIPNYPLHKLDLYARANLRRRLSPCRCLEASLPLLAESGAQDLIPVPSPRSRTPSLKQDSEAHGGGQFLV